MLAILIQLDLFVNNICDLVIYIMRIFRPKNTSFSFEYFFNEEELFSKSISLVEDPNDGEFICCALFRELVPFIDEFGSSKKYLIWCNEPVWMLPEEHDYASLESYCKQKYGVKLRVMSYHSNFFSKVSDIFLGSYAYKPVTFPPVPYAERSGKIIYLAGARDSDYYERSVQSNFTSLNRYRTRMALELHSNGFIDIFGKDWPSGVSIGESRSGDWINSKLDLIKNYRFCLALENTAASGYISEKIFQPISTWTLPIYFGGHNSSIYSIFPKNSFIDISQYNGIADMLSYINSMSESEFYDRLNVLRDIAYGLFVDGREMARRRALMIDDLFNFSSSL